MKVFVIGSLNMDLTIGAPKMPERGETVHGGGFMVTPGGKGANQATALARLGAETLMVGCVGNAFGKELIASLSASGADTRFIETKEDVSSGIAVIVVSGGDNRIILDHGANFRVGKELVDRALNEAEAGDFLVLQLEIELETVAYALAEAKKKGMVTVLNPAPAAQLPATVFQNVDYFTPNQSETQFYTGIYPDGEESAKRAAAVLKEKGVKNVIITLGEQGSACVSENGFVKAEAVPAEAVDTTAAGDTYVGAFVTKLSEGANLEEAMRFASAAAAVTVTRRGAQASIPTRMEADAMLRGRHDR